MLVCTAARCWILGRWAHVENSVYLHGHSLEGPVYGLVKSQSALSAFTAWGHAQPQQTLLVSTLGDTTETHEDRNTGRAPGQEYTGDPFLDGALWSFSGWSTLVLPVWHWSLEPDLMQTGPGKGLSQRQPTYQQQHNHRDSCSYSPLAPGTSPLHTTHHSLATDLGWTPWRKGQDHGLFLGKTTNDCTGVHTVTTWSSLASRAHFLWDRARATVPHWAWDSGLLLKQLGGRSSPAKAVTAKKKRKGPAQHLEQVLDTTPITSPYQGLTASTFWEMWLA